MTPALGVAGRMAAAFINSKLTPLVIVASMALGSLAVLALPREEEPQIIVPMVDVFVGLPGATPADIVAGLNAAMSSGTSLSTFTMALSCKRICSA